MLSNMNENSDLQSDSSISDEKWPTPEMTRELIHRGEQLRAEVFGRTIRQAVTATGRFVSQIWHDVGDRLSGRRTAA